MLFVCQPKFCINIVVVSLGAILTPKRNWSDKQRALWYVMVFLEWSICQNAVSSKIDITMTTINKKLYNRLNPNFARFRPATENATTGT